jgi:maleylpyruvate isomerase
MQFEPHGFLDPQGFLDKITVATEQLLRTAETFRDADVREPSLLPAWSRGHVLSHLARNADGGTRILTWARTGVENPEYPSVRARAEQIEAGHGRAAGELLADVRESAARFARAYAAMPGEAWSRIVRWTSGKARPAYRAADARLTEVLVHHVDLNAGFQPGDWPDDFVETTLSTVTAAYSGRDRVPDLCLVATDTGNSYHVGAQDNARLIQGCQVSLLAWLLGRSDGADLGESLPALPFLY